MSIKPLKWEYDNAGRYASFEAKAPGDCVVRAIAIATQQPYLTVYQDINKLAKFEKHRTRGRSSARAGVWRPTYEKYLFPRGWRWFSTMTIGSGCKVHLRQGELPTGRLIVAVSRHLTTVIDGVIHDTHDPSRGGNRCVYGYYYQQEE